MAITLRDFVAVALSPPWLRGYWGRRLVGVIEGLMGDAAAEALSQAVNAPWLRSGYQPPDALPPVGRERRMPRYPSDTDVTYRERLAEAWDTWRVAGNEGAVIGQLLAFGLPNVKIIPAENSDPRPERPAWRFEEPPVARKVAAFTYVDDIGGGKSAINAPAGVSFLDVVTATPGETQSFAPAPTKVLVSSTVLNDGYYPVEAVTAGQLRLSSVLLANEGPIVSEVDATRWSRFAVVIDQPHPWVPRLYGTGDFYGDDDDAPTYGSTATVGDVKTIKAIIRKWRYASAVNPRIWIIFSGSYYGDPDIAYGDAGLVYGGAAISWLHQGQPPW